MKRKLHTQSEEDIFYN